MKALWATHPEIKQGFALLPRCSPEEFVETLLTKVEYREEETPKLSLFKVLTLPDRAVIWSYFGSFQMEPDGSYVGLIHPAQQMFWERVGELWRKQHS